MAVDIAAAFGGVGGMAAGVPTPALPVGPMAGAGMGLGSPETGATAPIAPPMDFGSMMAAMAPTASPTPPTMAIDRLRPGSDAHAKVLQKLDAMLDFSRRKMKEHYARWNYNEQKVQAFTNVHDYDRLMGSLNKGGTLPEPIQVVVPYTYATLHAAATFVSTVLLGRKPVFPLLGVRGTAADKARGMESALQSHLDASRGAETLWQGIWDDFLYGFGPKRITWEERRGLAVSFGPQGRTVSEQLKFSGNVVSAIDPYNFYPDPRVPIHECNIKGDFMFTSISMSETVLRDMEKQQQLKWVGEAISKAKGRRNEDTESRRQVRLGQGGGIVDREPTNVVGFCKVFEGTVRLVPKDWGFEGEGSDVSAIWKFMWTEKGQIMQAEPLGMVHGQHPYVAEEPTSFGHDFMSLSMADMIGNFQDILSWLVTSRIENVRATVQNSFAVDPARIDLNDIRSSVIGRTIRMKQTAMGLPVKEAIMQIITQDVTQGHLADMQNMRVLADTITGVNDNMRGIQTAGGRRSATEARIAMQNGGGRLSQHAIRISAQGYHPMCEQMISNIQQFMPDEMWVEVAGTDGLLQSTAMTPNDLVGSYNYQISDGTLPFDKQALVEVWKELLMGVAQDPELRQAYSIDRIFEHTAEMGGAKNVSSFRRQQPQMQAGAAANPGGDPNMQPLGPAMPTAPLALGFAG